ncbi:MAG: hypothetical protein CM15mP120_12580 [Pseudomonadota bacterium]|nr:MAG: hypothetical protein CM15mP120_12580 [Pseudomonadota bacterium]
MVRPAHEFGLGCGEQDTQRTLLRDGGDSELSTALLRQAQRRGLPLALPLLDLQDTMQVSPGIVWGIFCRPWQPLLTAMGLSN